MVVQIQFKNSKKAPWKTDPFGYSSYEAAKSDMYLIKAKYKRLVSSRLKKVM